jgi:glycerol uptake facilitator-like aquaporin
MGCSATATATAGVEPADRPPPLWQRMAAEGLGTGALTGVLVGSGITAERLSADPGLRLLEISLATASGLAVLIIMFAPVSGAHLNPVVSVVSWLRGRHGGIGLSGRALAGYVTAQTTGATAGAILANVMYGLPAVQISASGRTSWSAAVSEIVATAGLVVVVLCVADEDRMRAAAAVSAYVFAACWCTPSTAFINPALTFGRVLTDSATGIAPASALVFVVAEVAGACVGLGLWAVVVAAGTVPPRPRRPQRSRPAPNSGPSVAGTLGRSWLPPPAEPASTAMRPAGSSNPPSLLSFTAPRPPAAAARVRQ